MSKARDRQARRKKQREQIPRRSSTQQVAAVDSNRPPRPRTPQQPMKIPGGRYLLLLPAAIILMGAVIAGLALFKPEDSSENVNAIWLGRDSTYVEQSPDALNTLTTDLRDNKIGTVFAFISSMKVDGTWSGDAAGLNRLTEVQTQVRDFATGFRQAYPDAILYGWIEVQASTPEGYRLDSTQVQRTVADLSKTVIDEYGYDGILLDVKPLFDGNDDFLSLLRTVRGSIGVDARIAVVVPADLTPTDAGIILPAQIAPDTVWSSEYKQRVIIQADTLVVTAYNSYLDDPVAYIDWVAYQVEAFVTAPGDIETNIDVFISVPNYDGRSPAHDPAIESLAGALDGVRRGLNNLDETLQPRLQGVAIFSDTTLSESDWQVYRQKWLQ